MNDIHVYIFFNDLARFFNIRLFTSINVAGARMSNYVGFVPASTATLK